MSFTFLCDVDLATRCVEGAGISVQREAVVAEWLRRLTRNQIPSGSVGSNPTGCEVFFLCFGEAHYIYISDGMIEQINISFYIGLQGVQHI